MWVLQGRSLDAVTVTPLDRTVIKCYVLILLCVFSSVRWKRSAYTTLRNYNTGN